MSNYYDINFEKINQWLLPFEKRKPKIQAVLRAMLKPLTLDYQSLILSYRVQLLKEVNLRSQKQLLEYYLNQRLFGGGNAIYFNDVDPSPGVNPFMYGYTNGESKMIGYTNDLCEFEEYDLQTYNFNTWDYVMYYPVSMTAIKLNEAIKIVQKVSFIGFKLKTQSY